MPHRASLNRRSSGILLHPTSLPGPFGSGDLGGAAYRFVDFLQRAGQTWWQMLPVGPVGAGFSPYDSPSSFAGNPMLISLELLADDGLLTSEELIPSSDQLNPESAAYEFSNAFRESRLRLASRRFFERHDSRRQDEFWRFVEQNRWWLRSYCLFVALRLEHGCRPWSEWAPELRRASPEALAKADERLQPEIRQLQFEQFQFDRQWTTLRNYARERQIALLGDVPMFVAHEGADVWQSQRLFHLDSAGRRTALAGVPPDYFSEEGQLWGNPLYRWDVLEQEGYRWLIDRLRHTLSRFDAVRLDHFIAFHRYWEIPAGATTAREGRFVEAPGHDFFKTLQGELGSLPFVAEDLGLVTNEVRRLRERFALPGMSVLQFGFANGAEFYLPHRAEKAMVVYTGTHDNNTIVGWLNEPGQHVGESGHYERQRAREYAGSDGTAFNWDMIRLALMSVVNTAIFPMQDVLGLGASARMNVPGTPSGNWRWRLSEEALGQAEAERLCHLCQLYQRTPDTAPEAEAQTSP